jgi:archaellum component FlaC
VSLSDVEVKIDNDIGKVDDEDTSVPESNNGSDSYVDLDDQVVGLVSKDEGVAGDRVDARR